MLKFVIDEDMPRSTARILGSSGYDVKDIRDYGLRGADDLEVYQFAQDNQAIIVTGDMDFSNILKFPVGSHWGIIIAHFPNEVSNDEINRQLLNRLIEFKEDDFIGNLVIIEPGKVRIRSKQR
ncbi:MAG: DUF5615 family PIN-like protein [Candidatus Poribacteria bacterium]